MKKGDTFAIQIDRMDRSYPVSIWNDKGSYDYLRATRVYPTFEFAGNEKKGILIDMSEYFESQFGTGSMIVIEFIEFDCDGDYIFRIKKPD